MKPSGSASSSITARPQDGYAHYTVVEHRGKFSTLNQYLAPNQTLMVEIKLHRHVREGVFRLTQDRAPGNFSKQAPSRKLTPRPDRLRFSLA